MHQTIIFFLKNPSLCRNNDDLDTNSSVFEGSDCSSLKIPWTPGYEDTVAAASFDIETSPTATTTQHKWSQSSVSNQQQQVSNSEEQTQPHYRKRGDILHENGGTGGSTKPSESIRLKILVRLLHFLCS